MLTMSDLCAAQSIVPCAFVVVNDGVGSQGSNFLLRARAFLFPGFLCKHVRYRRSGDFVDFLGIPPAVYSFAVKGYVVLHNT